MQPFVNVNHQARLHCLRGLLFALYLWTSHFGDDLPGLIEDGQPFRLRRVSTGQAAAQRAKQQVLKEDRERKLKSKQHRYQIKAIMEAEGRGNDAIFRAHGECGCV